jgi:hypothetical protein
MIAVVLTALLYLAVFLFLAGAGFLSGLAAMDWLILAGLTAFATLASVLLYRGALRGWVRRRSHPASLRMLSAMTGVYLWFAVLAAFYWDLASASLAWGDAPASGIFTLAGVLVLALVFIAFGYGGRRRIGGA